MKEYQYDKLLNIHTGGYQKDSNQSFHYYPYEPTQYSALETLFTKYELKSSDHVVDFGCGKGRLNFFIHYYYNATVTGIEMDKTFYQIAIENRNSYAGKNKDNIHFHCCLAEEYQIAPQDNRFYFFNPFSKEIFINTINNILMSVERTRRDIELILYYSSDDYIYFLENDTSFELKEEIIIPDLSKNDPYERFLIYRLV
ncbi:SAM-dependent methyltransferase [Virgibacillus phasianinus]|uniref:SAM-dependent methyltransferase n=1 Tax=Virgibacillus phasianinus TaxID=2017483 RepID=A0A220U169_9BACI|nr:methyltransferase domain-containing protein [Virgibacillus phasianinus]ASK61867.1 SAM-dependent methyltransferase [Virgibacillus phasianinus]